MATFARLLRLSYQTIQAAFGDGIALETGAGLIVMENGTDFIQLEQ